MKRTIRWGKKKKVDKKGHKDRTKCERCCLLRCRFGKKKEKDFNYYLTLILPVVLGLLMLFLLILLMYFKTRCEKQKCDLIYDFVKQM